MKEINYSHGMTMNDAPLLRKTGVVSAGGETTPFVWHGRLYRSEVCTEREPVPGERFLYRIKAYYCTIFDVETREPVARTAENMWFAQTYEENGRIYVFATDNSGPDEEERSDLYVFVSDDMKTWEKHFLFRRPGYRLHNTSVAKGPDGYVMAIELACCDGAGGLRWDAGNPCGHPFTEYFLTSDDLLHWNWMPDDRAYTRDRYNACPALRYADGYWYMICLEALPLGRYAPYIYRTADFETWEIGYHNPIMIMSPEDRRIQPGVVLDDETRYRVEHCFDINNSDVDLCEFDGKTILYYSVGDQMGPGHVAEAIYDGPMGEYLRRLFE